MFNKPCQSCTLLAQELREQRLFFENIFREGTSKALGTNYAEYKAVMDKPPQDAAENEEDTNPYLDWDEVDPKEVLNYGTDQPRPPDPES